MDLGGVQLTSDKKAEVMQQVKQQIAIANLQETIQVNTFTFDKRVNIFVKKKIWVSAAEERVSSIHIRVPCTFTILEC